MHPLPVIVRASSLLMFALLLTAGDLRAYSVEGFTEPLRKIEVSPAEPGTITKIFVQEGETVRAGHLLGTLDCDVLLVSLEMAKANMEAKGRLDSATAERNLRKTRLEKLVLLRERGHASQEEIGRATADLEIAEASVVAATENQQISALEYKKTEALIERRRLRSPISGLVTRVHREETEFVSPTEPTVFTVVQLDSLRVTFSVPTEYTKDMKVGQPVPISFPDSDEQAEGKLEFVSPITEAESGTVRIKVVIANPAGKYRCGVRCALELPDFQTPVAVSGVQ